MKSHWLFFFYQWRTRVETLPYILNTHHWVTPAEGASFNHYPHSQLPEADPLALVQDQGLRPSPSTMLEFSAHETIYWLLLLVSITMGHIFLKVSEKFLVLTHVPTDRSVQSSSYMCIPPGFSSLYRAQNENHIDGSRSSGIVYLCINNVNSRLLPSLDSLPTVTTETSQINTYNQFSYSYASYNVYRSHLTSTWPTYLQVQVQIPTYFQYTCQFVRSISFCCKSSISIQGLFTRNVLASVRYSPLLPPANEVWGKVMFLHLSVIFIIFWFSENSLKQCCKCHV